MRIISRLVSWVLTRIAVTRRNLLNRMAEYVSGADEWWEDFYAPASNDTLKMYAAKIVSALAFNSGSIDEIHSLLLQQMRDSVLI